MKVLNDDILPRYYEEAQERARAQARTEAAEQHLSDEEAAELEQSYVSRVPKPTIGIKAARRWLCLCGFKWFQKGKRGRFTDGHNRADVVQRRLAVCAQLIDLTRRTARYLFNNSTNAWRFESPVDLSACELELVSQDESIFYA